MRLGRKGPLLPADAELIRSLAALLDETGLTEIEYAVGDRRIRVARVPGNSPLAPNSPVIAEAVHVTGDAAEALLAEAQAGGPPHPVIAPYLIDAAVVDGWLRPLSLREQIRAFGPTVRSPNPEAV